MSRKGFYLALILACFASGCAHACKPQQVKFKGVCYWMGKTYTEYNGVVYE